ncbi:MAG: SDR family oxidoreductase [Acidimicrobiales bacterium]
MGTALIIGGSGGLGSAMVRRFAGAGDDVVFTYLMAQSAAHALVEECAPLAGRVTAERFDLRRLDRLEEIVEKAGDDLRCVVLSAASGIPKPLTETRAKHWEWTFAVNVRPVVPIFQHSFEALKATGGCMIACTSLGSRLAAPYYGLLGAAKAAVEATVRYAAVEGGPHGIRVNALCPGPIETKALKAFPDVGRGLLEAARRTPMRRLATCEEVAGIAFWLASREAAMITGQVIIVDGGLEIVGPFGEYLGEYLRLDEEQ